LNKILLKLPLFDQYFLDASAAATLIASFAEDGQLMVSL
jgi:hypothetical protein